MNSTTLRALTWGTVVAAVCSAFLLAMLDLDPTERAAIVVKSAAAPHAETSQVHDAAPASHVAR